MLLGVGEARITDASFINRCDLLELRPVCQKCRLEVTGKPGANPELTQHGVGRQMLVKEVHLPAAI